MKNRKRLIVYSLLAVPFVVFGIYLLTLDPIARQGFLTKFQKETAKQFTLASSEESETDATQSPTTSAPAAGRDGESRQRGGGRGGADAAQIFAEQDADGDGKLTGDEISERMQQNLERIDADKDGSITLEELQAGFGRRAGGNRGGRDGFDPTQLFSRRDENGDGKLTGDEIGDRMRGNLDAIDTDGDGGISLAELQAGLANIGGGGGRGGRGRPDENDAERPERPQRPE